MSAECLIRGGKKKNFHWCPVTDGMSDMMENFTYFKEYNSMKRIMLAALANKNKYVNFSTVMT